MQETEWDKYKDTMSCCLNLGCKKWNMSVCCPELMTVLCRPKSRFLKKARISEERLDNNEYTCKEIVWRIQDECVESKIVKKEMKQYIEASPPAERNVFELIDDLYKD